MLLGHVTVKRGVFWFWPSQLQYFEISEELACSRHKFCCRVAVWKETSLASLAPLHAQHIRLLYMGCFHIQQKHTLVIEKVYIFNKFLCLNFQNSKFTAAVYLYHYLMCSLYSDSMMLKPECFQYFKELVFLQHLCLSRCYQISPAALV